MNIKISPETLDPILCEMESVMKDQLRKDETISARSVASKLKSVSAASSLTRNVARKELIEKFKAKQSELRRFALSDSKKSKGKLQENLNKCKERINSLENENQILIASHMAMISIVGELGGFPKWKKMFSDYKNAFNYLQKSGALSKENISHISK